MEKAHFVGLAQSAATRKEADYIREVHAGECSPAALAVGGDRKRFSTSSVRQSAKWLRCAKGLRPVQTLLPRVRARSRAERPFSPTPENTPREIARRIGSAKRLMGSVLGKRSSQHRRDCGPRRVRRDRQRWRGTYRDRAVDIHKAIDYFAATQAGLWNCSIPKRLYQSVDW